MVNLKVKSNSSDLALPPDRANSKQNSIRILLVDDQNSIRQHLLLSLEPEPDFNIIGSAANGKSAIALFKTLDPDVALIDIEMPRMNGLEATQIIKQQYPNTKIIVLSSHSNDEYIDEAIKAGATGYLLKNTPASEIIHAIRYVHKGYLQLGPGLHEKLEANRAKAITTVGNSSNHNQSQLVVESKPPKELVKANRPQPANSDWSSMTKELIDTLPRVWTRGLLYFLMVFVGIVLPWAMLSKVDETGSARGKLEPQGKVFAVDAPVAGTVDEVLVSEGQLVSFQQPLLSLESEPIESELEQVLAKLEGQQQELAQLNLLRNQLVLTINTQKQQNTAEQLEKQTQLDKAQQDIQHKRVARHLAKKSLDEAKKEVQRYKKAKEQGIVSEIQVVEKEDSVRERERLLEQASFDSEQAQLSLTEQSKSYQSLIHSGEIAVFKNSEQLKEIEKQIVVLNSNIKENQSQIDNLEYQLEQRIAKAPVSGSIFQLPPQKTGSMLEPGAMVAEIAPKQSDLILKAQMIPTESGSIDPGMPVKLKFDAYPFQDFGIVSGELIKISPTTKAVDTSEGKVESYELEIKLKRNYIQAKNRRVALRPGQTATAEVVVRQRRLIDFVLDPFKKLNQDGLEL